MQQYLLSCLVFTPLIGALACVFIPRRFFRTFRWISLFACVAQLFFLVQAILAFQADKGLQLIEQKQWIKLNLGSWGTLQAEYFLGVDGLSLPLVALTVVIMLVATFSSWNIEKQVKGYFILLLILNAAIIGS